MDSGSNWHRGEKEIVELNVNATQTQANTSIDEVMLNITHFNISRGNASILIQAENGTAIPNQTEVSGTFASGFTSHVEVPPSNVTKQRFAVIIIWEGTNTTVSFEYWKYDLLFWDSIPYAVVDFGFFVFVSTGLSLITASVFLFLVNCWLYGKAEVEHFEIQDYFLLFVGFLIPSLLKIRVVRDELMYRVQATIWYYVYSMILGGESRIHSTVEPRPDYFGIGILISHTILVLSFWLYLNKSLPRRKFVLLFWLSPIPIVAAVFLPLFAAFLPIEAYFLSIPLPLLQLGLWLLNRNETITESEETT
jgi:hypothetical protein